MTGEPVVLTTLTPWFEHMLSRPQHGIITHITQTVLSWDKDRTRATLDLSNIQVTDRLGQSIASIPQVLIVLKPLGYFDDSHSPWIVAAHGANIHARFDKKGVLKPGAMEGGATSVPNANANTALTAETARQFLQDIIRNPLSLEGLGLIANLTLNDLSFTVIDEERQVNWNLQIPELSLKRLHDDYTGMAKVKIIKNDIETTLDFTLAYDNREGVFRLTWSFDHLKPDYLADYVPNMKALTILTAPLTGTMSVDIARDMDVRSGAFNLNLDAGQINLPDFYAAPLTFTAGQIVARYDGKEKTLYMEPLRLDLAHAALEGKIAINVDTEPHAVEASFTFSNLSVAHLPLYWPEKAGVNARVWILENIHEGMIEKATVNLDLAIPGVDFANAAVTRLDGGVDVKDVRMTCWAAIPQLDKAAATSTFTAKGFDIKVLSGEMGSIRLKESPVTITGLDETDQIMNLQAHIVGPVPDILAVLDRNPMNYARKIGIKPADTSGKADGVLSMTFPLLKDLLLDDTEISAEVKAENASIKRIADLMEVSDATLTLKTDKKVLTFEGNALLNGVRANVKWRELFEAKAGEALSLGTVKAEGKAQDAAKFGVALEMESTAAFPIEVVYERGAVTSKLTVKGEISSTEFKLPMASFTKPAGKSAQFTTALEWGGKKPMHLSTIDVTGEGLQVKGQGTFAGQSLASLSLNPVRFGKNNASLNYHKEKAVPSLTIKGEALDISHFLNSAGTETPPSAEAEPTPLEVDMDVASVYTGGPSPLTNVVLKATRDTLGWRAIAMKGAAEGTPFNFDLTPKEDGHLELLFTTSNFGHVLKALDITNTVIGGKLSVDGKSGADDKTRSIFGHIRMEHYRVTNMPVLAQFLSGISTSGTEGLVNDQGLNFAPLIGEFMWNKEAFVINKASTSSGSLGLTTAGIIDLRKDTVTLEGQIVPVYFLNKILSAIPLIGDLLTGGEGGGVFAATYRVSGPLAKPKVSVNPVSVLAPGILRTILFTTKGVTDVKEEEAETPPVSAAPTPLSPPAGEAASP